MSISICLSIYLLWYSKSKTFSLTLMKDTVAHCNKTIDKTASNNIKDTETHLKNITEREEYQSIEKPSKTMKQTPNKSYNKESSKSSII